MPVDTRTIGQYENREILLADDLFLLQSSDGKYFNVTTTQLATEIAGLIDHKLSVLIIDVDKDWQTKRITNVGDPINPQDVVTKAFGDANYIEFFGPWTDNHDAGGNNFLLSGGLIQFADANTTISQAGANMDFAIASGTYGFKIVSTQFSVSDTKVNIHGNILDLNGGHIQFDNVLTRITQVINSLEFDIDDTKSYVFQILNTDEFSISQASINVHNKRIVNVSDPTGNSNAVNKGFADANYSNADSLNDLSDVIITAPTINDILVSDVEGTFVNGQGIFAGITGLGIQTQDLDMDINNILTTGKVKENGINISPIGLHDIWLDVGGIVPVDSELLDTRIVGTGDNQKSFSFIPFLNAVNTFAVTKFKLPRNWDNGTITVVITWTTDVEGVGDVLWGIAGAALGDSDDISSVNYGTEITVLDTQLDINNIQDSPRTASITLSNTPADLDTILLRIRRLGVDVTDTFTQPAQLLGMSIELTTNEAVSA